MPLKQNFLRALIFTFGVLSGAALAVAGCWLMVSRVHPEMHPAVLVDKKITEIKLSANTYAYTIAYNDAELSKINDSELVKRMAEHARQNGMNRFIVIKVEPKQFCAAVAVHPAAHVLLMRPLAEDPPEIVELKDRVKAYKAYDEL